MIELNKGTKEEIVIDVTDLLGNLTSLSEASPYFYVYKADDNAAGVVGGGTPSITDMSAYCLIDDSAGAYGVGEYNLYLKFTSSDETPILGPVKFRINSL